MATSFKSKIRSLGKIKTVGGRFKLLRCIGSGSFGEIYLANDLNDAEVAVKLESKDSSSTHLFDEYQIYRLLGDAPGIPHAMYYGSEKGFNALALDYLGPSLENLFNICQRIFTLKTVLMLFDQMLQRIQYIHSKGVIHRDLKPENFLMGNKWNQYTVFLIDYGLSKLYRDSRTHAHIPCREGRHLVGTARYVSINTHRGTTQSRRDDMESLGYLVLYFLRGSLPWQNMKAKSKKQKYEKILEKKLSTPIEVLCKEFPSAFASYLHACRGLKFEDVPDYVGLRNIFRSLFKTLNFEYDNNYDWIVLQSKSSKDEQNSGSKQLQKKKAIKRKATPAANIKAKK